jgi:uncharacterized membrane protein
MPFETIFGIPAHPLIIHAAVVFIPLLIGATLVYAWVPPLRKKINWAVFLLAFVAPLSALFAKLSGDEFRARLVKRNLAPPPILTQIDLHRSYGTTTLFLTIGLGVLALVLLFVPLARERIPAIVLAVGALVLCGFTAYFVFQAGDTAAHIVWAGF